MDMFSKIGEKTLLLEEENPDFQFDSATNFLWLYAPKGIIATQEIIPKGLR